MTIPPVVGTFLSHKGMIPIAIGIVIKDSLPDEVIQAGLPVRAGGHPTKKP